jgi:hydroxylamine reductase (hybrid-cluster protein)
MTPRLKERYKNEIVAKLEKDLGIKNIKLGPTLPAFISSNVLNVLVENYGIAPISTPEADLAELLD